MSRMVDATSNPLDLGPRLLTLFEHVFIVNLEFRTDRRQEMAEQLRLIGLSLAHPQITLFPAVRPENPGKWPSIGARGCFMSHLLTLREARSMGLGTVLILEDDLDWSSCFLSDGAAMLSRLEQAEWDFVHGGYEDGATGQPELNPVLAETGLQMTHFIGLKGNINQIEAYLTAMTERQAGDPQGGPMHVDGAYSWYRKVFPQTRSWIYQPAIGIQRASRTDIHDLKWFDRIPVVSGIVGLLRKLKNNATRARSS